MTAREPGLAVAIHRTGPFVRGRRGDGTLLADYLDGHRILGEPSVLAAVGEELSRRIPPEADHVAGEVAAGSALAMSVSLAALARGRRLPARTLRREPKEHGVTGVLSTAVPPGSRFALVDDVAGTGACLERGTLRLRELGHRVVGAWVVVDRQNGAAERLAELGVPLHALLTLDELRASGPGRDSN
ncbi:orotate phosphoribosyltransferase [Kitasatospora sp. NPDC093550]|uniref:orotate phosphoribosyltransferase n=1 Tax=Kitasatospora sp. NPDC093550 TaxID=3364089 RepID=UPI00382E03AD